MHARITFAPDTEMNESNTVYVLIDEHRFAATVLAVHELLDDILAQQSLDSVDRLAITDVQRKLDRLAAPIRNYADPDDNLYTLKSWRNCVLQDLDTAGK